MSTSDRSTVMGTFKNRAQAEQAINALGRIGFGNELIGFAGRDEVLEKLDTNIPTRAGQALSSSVVVTVKAGQRWREALDILHSNGASDTTPSLDEASEDDFPLVPTDHKTQASAMQPHLEYDPVAGPRMTTENTAPIASGEYGLKRDPTLDTDTSISDPNVNANATAQEEGGDTFFGQTVEPGSPDDPNIRSPRTP